MSPISGMCSETDNSDEAQLSKEEDSGNQGSTVGKYPKSRDLADFLVEFKEFDVDAPAMEINVNSSKGESELITLSTGSGSGDVDICFKCSKPGFSVGGYTSAQGLSSSTISSVPSSQGSIIEEIGNVSLMSPRVNSERGAGDPN